MREVIQQLIDSLDAGRPLSYCRLVETRGSTPQKAGALMLVYEDGSQAGTLGGGCVEADVKRRALAVLQSGQAEVAKFQLDSDYGWDDGLICGGRMLALIEPLPAGSQPRYFCQLAELAAQGESLTEAIVFDNQSSDLPLTASYLFDGQEQLLGTLHDDSPAENTIANLRDHLQPVAGRPLPYAARGVAFLPMYQRCRLLIVGGGHVGQAVADLAANLDFEVCVTDDRADIISRERFPKAAERIPGAVDAVLPDIAITPNTYCLIVTRGHNHDEEALYYLAQRGAAYVGLIGSKRKIKMIFEDLLEQGISAEALQRVHAPVGIDIGSQSVPEIAVSIAAELVAFRNLQGKVPGRPQSVTV